MRNLDVLEFEKVSGGNIKADMGVYTLAVGGLSISGQGLVATAAGLCIANGALVKAGLASLGIGASMVGAAAYCEYNGISELQGWYELSQNVKYYKAWTGF
jgi:hypothetical protein